ncbi:hypothetical protein [Pseudoalteromonas sp. S554]|uniref:hypothetical protein n=1 Tax=Pseudoalteromonas sp. S554 TaxID=2066516 RepID=UPI00110D1C72|nr:hypothetical protein [Pseudoalteromonas sp. S554]TMS80210.1 hypothetical protein CWB65_15540 [Pseudoalteromonas sp. S554]
MKKSEKKPDVLRVTEFILDNNKSNKKFSLAEAAETKELNGIGLYRIAEIIKNICLQPNGPDSINDFTRISNNNLHNQQGDWQLTPTAYFSYLTYLSIKESEKSNRIAIKTYKVAITAVIIAVISAVIAA